MFIFLYKNNQINSIMNLGSEDMHISSLENTHIKDIIKLKNKKYRDLTKTFIVEGEHLVIEAYKNGLLKELILLEDESFNLDVLTTYVTNKLMSSISSLDNYGTIIGICQMKEEKKIGNKVLILENIADPGNLGTIIRSSVAFNIDTIVLSLDTVDLYNEKVIRATQGLLFSINIIKRDIITVINELKNNDILILGTKVDGGNSIDKFNKLKKYALIMGNEGKGVTAETSALCDDFVYIKTNKLVESLNVGVATSILLYELNKELK